MITMSRRAGGWPSQQARTLFTYSQHPPRIFSYKRTSIVSPVFSFLNDLFGKTWLDYYFPHAGVVISSELPKRWRLVKEIPESYKTSIKISSDVTLYPHTMTYLNKGCEIKLLTVSDMSPEEKREFDMVMEVMKKVFDDVQCFETEAKISISQVKLK